MKKTFLLIFILFLGVFLSSLALAQTPTPGIKILRFQGESGRLIVGQHVIDNTTGTAPLYWKVALSDGNDSLLLRHFRFDTSGVVPAGQKGFANFELDARNLPTGQYGFNLTIGTWYTPLKPSGGLLGVEFVVTKTAGVETLGGPEDFFLAQNYPNPFNPSTTIEFAIPAQGFVSLKVFNVLGQEVASLVSEVKSVGKYSVRFDGGNLPSGVYIYQLRVGKYAAIKKLVLLR